MRNKRGQVTLFVIIALVIIVLAALAYFLIPRLGSGAKFDSNNPEAFIQSCVKDDLQGMLNLISIQGGSLDPAPYFLYKDNKIQYLCYNAENYEFCKVQVPFIKNHIEEEVQKNLEERVKECFSELGKKYEGKGYSFDLSEGSVKATILPRKILLETLNYRIAVSKNSNAEDTQTFNSFNIVANTNLYELLAITSNIIDWESSVGDADTSVYMLIYPDEIKIQKLKQSDDTKVYIIENKKTGEIFQFASRSLAFPPGY